MEINNRIELEAWLDRQGLVVARAIGKRTALRVLPLIAYYLGEQTGKRASSTGLSLFRDAAALWYKGIWPIQSTVEHEITSGNIIANVINPNISGSIKPSNIISNAINPNISGSIKSNDIIANVINHNISGSIKPSNIMANAINPNNLSVGTIPSGIDADADAITVRAVTAAMHAARKLTNSRNAGDAVLAATRAARSAAAARSANRVADVGAVIWIEIMVDAGAIEKGMSANTLMRYPLWNGSAPKWADENWTMLKSDLLALDEDWRVWTDWFDDRLRGADHPGSRPLIEALERERVLIPDEDWEKGPKHVNAMIAALEVDYRAEAPPQRPAIIEVEYGEDRKLHRRSSPPPKARNEAQEQRLREAWLAHSAQLAVLEEMDPGKNSPAFGRALNNYRAALGRSFEAMKVIALGVHGAGFIAYAERADALLLEDAAAELVGLAATHGLFIRQFDAWLDYLNDATGEPSIETVEAAIQVARSTGDAPDLIADDVVAPLNGLADMAERPLAANPEDRPPRIVERELLRSVGNVLSGILGPLLELARDSGGKAREGMLGGVKHFANLATLAVAIAGTEYVVTLATGAPGQFGWLIPVLKFLKMKLGL
ncbi:MAG: hypothetical protein HOI19_17745 [Rhodospirillaceae bacterium]|jgi:hypothetical protein|nr:hypothetical protein [Rhodospirillaceae bacterium]